MKKGKLLMISALSVLLTIPLTGCELPELPLAEQVSLKIVIDELGSQVEGQSEKSKSNHVPPGLAKKGGLPPGLAKAYGMPPGQAKKAHNRGDNVVTIGGLIHPKDAKHPQLIGPGGEYYELVNNHTTYDILQIRAQVPFFQAKLVITGQKSDSTYYAELVEIVGQGTWFYGELEKDDGRYQFKVKEDGRGKGKGKKKDTKYIIVQNHTGQRLDRLTKKDHFFFVQVISEHGERAQVRLLDIR